MTPLPPDVNLRIIAGENPTLVIREWRGLSREELAAKVGCPATLIEDVERAEWEPIRLMARIANALDVRLDDLVPVEGPR